MNNRINKIHQIYRGIEQIEFIEFINEQNEQQIQKYLNNIYQNSKFFMNFVFNSINRFDFNYFYNLFSINYLNTLYYFVKFRDIIFNIFFKHFS